MKDDKGFCKSRFLRIRGRLARRRLEAERLAEKAGAAQPRVMDEHQKRRAEDFTVANATVQKREGAGGVPDNKRGESRTPVVRYLRREFSR